MTGRDRVLPATRALAVFIVPFLLTAFVLLSFWPSADDTGRLFAWRIAPDFTSMMLASAYLGGAYFFVRAASASRWHRIAGGFLPVVLFSGLLGVATAAQWRWDHKTVFSLLGWTVFAALLLGRQWRGWRGRRATRWLYAGAVLLLLAYVGSRFVFEVLVPRG